MPWGSVEYNATSVQIPLICQVQAHVNWHREQTLALLYNVEYCITIGGRFDLRSCHWQWSNINYCCLGVAVRINTSPQYLSLESNILLYVGIGMLISHRACQSNVRQSTLDGVLLPGPSYDNGDYHLTE